MTDLLHRSKVALSPAARAGSASMIASGFVTAERRSTSLRARPRSATRWQQSSQARECISLPLTCPPRTGCRGLAAELATREARLDILVNNAAATWGAPLETFDEAAMGTPVLALNVKVSSTPPVPPPFARGGRDSRAARTSSHRLHRRTAHPGHGDLLLFGVEGSGAHAHPPSRQALAPAVTVNAIRPGPFESKMMDRHSRPSVSRSHSPPRSDGSGARMTWPAPPSSCRQGRAYLTGAVIPRGRRYLPRSGVSRRVSPGAPHVGLSRGRGLDIGGEVEKRGIRITGPLRHAPGPMGPARNGRRVRQWRCSIPTVRKRRLLDRQGPRATVPGSSGC